jgi:DNA mismatch endonuclease (patch repair protein)
MADRLTPEARSRLMARVRGKDTKPELAVRRLLHAMGYRFRLHRKDLPGTPDIVLPGRGTAIFVHGCFWHRHSGCRYATVPGTRPDYWIPKFARNVERDEQARQALKDAGWVVGVIWECQTKDPSGLEALIKDFLFSRSEGSRGSTDSLARPRVRRMKAT